MQQAAVLIGLQQGDYKTDYQSLDFGKLVAKVFGGATSIETVSSGIAFILECNRLTWNTQNYIIIIKIIMMKK